MSKNTAQKMKLSINPFVSNAPFPINPMHPSLPSENIRKDGIERGIERVHLEQMG